MTDPTPSPTREDTAAAMAALQNLATELAAVFAQALTPIVEALTQALTGITGAFHFAAYDIHALVIDRLDITEADIRRITRTHVHLWNGRRIPYTVDELLR